MPTANISAKELAVMCETDPRTLRKFIREQYRSAERDEELPGQGGRYSFSAVEARKLKAAFVASAAKTASKAAAKKTKQVEVVDDDVEEVEDDLEFADLDEPTEEELEEVDEDEDEDEVDEVEV